MLRNPLAPKNLNKELDQLVKTGAKSGANTPEYKPLVAMNNLLANLEYEDIGRLTEFYKEMYEESQRLREKVGIVADYEILPLQFLRAKMDYWDVDACRFIIQWYYLECKVKGEVLTVSGLARRFNMNKEELLQYLDNEEEKDVRDNRKLMLRDAMRKIEEQLEQAMYTKTVLTGVSMGLKNFFNWQDKKEIDVNTQINVRISNIVNRGKDVARLAHDRKNGLPIIEQNGDYMWNGKKIRRKRWRKLVAEGKIKEVAGIVENAIIVPNQPKASEFSQEIAEAMTHE